MKETATHRITHTDHTERHNHAHHDHMSDHQDQVQQPHQGHGAHHGHDPEEFKRRFWLSIVLTIPILVLSHAIQSFLGLENALHFTGSEYVLFALSAVLFVYGG